MSLVAELMIFPTVIFAGLVVLSAAYWMAVIVGAIGVEVLDPDLGGHGIADPHGADGEAGVALLLAHTLTLGRTPLTVALSVFALLGFLISYFSLHALQLVPLLPQWAASVATAPVAVVGAALGTRAAVWPLGALFETREAETRSASVGRVCEIRSATVDASQGHAEIQDGGAGQVVSVRCDTPNVLKRGARALIVGYDADSGVYDVEPMTLLGESDPAYSALAAQIEASASSTGGAGEAAVRERL